MSGVNRAACVLAILIGAGTVRAGAVPQSGVSRPAAGGDAAAASAARASTSDRPTMAAAQRLFYNGSYEAAAALAIVLQGSDTEGLAAHELRTSALHFQIRRALGEPADKDRAFKECRVCPDLMAAFLRDVASGQTQARARLQSNAEDVEARFLLAKLDLNYVWLQLDTLGRRTGWSEFREARRSVDAVLKHSPGHVRARVAQAWILYIVDTRVPRGFRWILGGGNRQRGLAGMREAADMETDVFAKAEAGFALWEMLIRERCVAEAVTTAQGLARDFPDNPELVRFLEVHRGSWP